MPANTKIWVQGSFSCETPVLLDADDNEVSITMSEITPNLLVLSPAALLVVGESYTLDCNSFLSSTFTVGGPEDTLAPAVPQLTPGETHRSGFGDSCGDTEFVRMEGQHTGDLLLMDVAGRATFDETTLSGSVVDVFIDGSAFIGSPACSSNWDFDEDGEAEDVRFGALDLAGNFSGWSSPQLVSPACGCQLPGRRQSSGGGLALSLVALAAMALRRRRARD